MPEMRVVIAMVLLVLCALLLVLRWRAPRRRRAARYGGGPAVSPAEKGDLNEIHRLADLHRSDAIEAGWIEVGPAPTREEVESASFERYRTLVVRQEGTYRLKGFISARPSTAWRGGAIRLVVVDPAHRGQGIGSALIAAAMETLPAGSVRLVVAEQNEAARRLYERLGFAYLTPDEEGPDLIMSKGN